MNECEHQYEYPKPGAAETACKICGKKMAVMWPARENRVEPDPLYIKSWELAVTMVAPQNRVTQYVRVEPDNSDITDYIVRWQAYFYEQLKGGTE